MSQSQVLQNSKVDLLSTKSQNLNGRVPTGAGTAVNDSDLISLGQVKSLITQAGGKVPVSTASATTNAGVQVPSISDILNGSIIDLTSMVTGVLPTTNGGSGTNYATFAALVAAIQAALIGFSGTVALAKLTPITGANGSLTVVNGIITAYSAPT